MVRSEEAAARYDRNLRGSDVWFTLHPSVFLYKCFVPRSKHSKLITFSVSPAYYQAGWFRPPLRWRFWRCWEACSKKKSMHPRRRLFAGWKCATKAAICSPSAIPSGSSTGSGLTLCEGDLPQCRLYAFFLSTTMQMPSQVVRPIRLGGELFIATVPILLESSWNRDWMYCRTRIARL